MVSQFRARLLLSGLGGLLVAGIATGVGIALRAGGAVEPPFSFLPLTLLLVVIFGGFSLAEIPLMVFALRRLAMERRGNAGVVLGLNALYVFFAAVYGLPVLLLAPELAWGLALCALSLVRLASSQLFVQEPAT